jgi:hypothetical protein
MNKKSIFTNQDIKDTFIFTLSIIVPLVIHKLDKKNKLNEENQKQPWERSLPSYMYPTDIAQTQYNKNLWEKIITFFNLIGHLKQIYRQILGESSCECEVKIFEHARKTITIIEEKLQVITQQEELLENITNNNNNNNDTFKNIIKELQATCQYTVDEKRNMILTLMDLKESADERLYLRMLKNEDKKNNELNIRLHMHEKSIEESITILKKEQKKYANPKCGTNHPIYNKLKDYINDAKTSITNIQNLNITEEKEIHMQNLTFARKELAIAKKQYIPTCPDETLKIDEKITAEQHKIQLINLNENEITHLKNFINNSTTLNNYNIIEPLKKNDPIMDKLAILLPQEINFTQSQSSKIFTNNNINQSKKTNTEFKPDIYIDETEIYLMKLLSFLTDNNFINNNNNNINTVSQELKKILQAKKITLQEKKLYYMNQIVKNLNINTTSQQKYKETISEAWLNNNQLNQQNI